MNKTLIARPLAVALAALTSTYVHAVSFTQNDVTLDINGTVNGFYANRQVDSTDATGKTTSTTDSALTNGLLPGWINFVATAKAEGQDIKAHISFAPGINSNSKVVGLPIGNNSGAGTSNPYSQIDTRNLYFQFGNSNWGTLKFGRDIGLFGQDIILSDMTLIGVGGTTGAAMPYNTTFGMIGHGYMYTGFQPQITYSTPKMGGLSAAVGIFQPSKFAGDQTKSPGFQAKADYDFNGGKVWLGMVSQSTSGDGKAYDTTGKASTDAGYDATKYDMVSGKSFSASGYEFGGKMGFGNFEAVAYTFSGSGLGLSTIGAQFFGGSDGNGNKTKSNGYFLQGTYKMGATKVGLNVGQNKDKDGSVGLGVEKKNASETLGLYHTLNKYVTLVGEINQEKITTSGTAAATKTRTISLGGIMFF